MSRKGWFIIFIYFVVFTAVLTALFGRKFFVPKKIHYHAGFVVFENDKKKDFSDWQYMNVQPCTVEKEEHEEPVSDEDIQIEKAHLHENVGDVVHIEREGAKWKDLFVNLHFPINYANVRAYVNGKEVKNLQEQPIRPYDSLIVFIGKNNIQQHLSQGVEKSHIQSEEKKSEDCGE